MLASAARGRVLSVSSFPPGRRPLLAFFLRDERRFVSPQREQDLPEIVDLIEDGSIGSVRVRRLPR